jgi:hypothetical protein
LLWDGVPSLIMLSHIVRRMVQTQVRLLANSRATRHTLICTIAHWLGFLGVHAQVNELDAEAGKIHISLTVGKPDACDSCDWQQILHKLNPNESDCPRSRPDPPPFPPHQQTKMQRLLAYLIQVGNPTTSVEWETLHPELQALGFEDSTLHGIRAALKVPQALDDLLDGLDPDMAAIALPKAVSLAMMDHQVNSSEDQALLALLKAVKHE